MSTKSFFLEKLEKKWSEGKFVCVGLDTDILKIPTAHILGSKYMRAYQVVSIFNKMIIDATKDIVCAYKPNTAFYESCGAEGFIALKETIAYANEVAPDVVVVIDAKRADIGNTNKGYAEMAFDYLQGDAITVNPYLGQEALEPFLKQENQGIVVLCKTSNPGAGEFQNRMVLLKRQEMKDLLVSEEIFQKFRYFSEFHPGFYRLPLYQIVAAQVANKWNTRGNCALVVGATYPDELKKVRQTVGDLPILIPGIGTQGGDLKETVLAGKNSQDNGMIINSSRGIIYASKDADFAEAARRETQKLHDSITQILQGDAL